MRRFTLCATAVLTLASAAAALAEPGYRLDSAVTLKGPSPGWDYLTSNGIDGNIVMYDEAGPDRLTFAGAFTTRPIARTMALNPKAGRIYTATAEGVVDPAKPVNKRAGAFYPNHYIDDTFTVLTYAPD